MSNQKFVALSIGPHGFTGYLPTEKTTCGSISAYTSRYGDPDLSQAQNGCVVIDTRPAEKSEYFTKYVLAAPLLDVDLKGDEVECCPEPSEMLASGVANNVFGAMLDYHKQLKSSGKKIGSLDKVSPSFLAAWWIRRGGRAGIVKDGNVIWHKGRN